MRSVQSKHVYWSDAEIGALRDFYLAQGNQKLLSLQSLADSLGRNKANVCRKARELGLTNQERKFFPDGVPSKRKTANAAELKALQGQIVSDRWKEKGHPRGMLGKSHSKDSIARASATRSATWASHSQDRKDEITMNQIKGKIAKYGTLAQPIARGTWKAGWREIGGTRKYYRSKWEANYGWYLQWLKDGGHIAEWKHEPKTFWFEGIKRGNVSYLPDFWVRENDGSEAYHEVKGWMDAGSKTKIARMAKYFPETKLVVIDSKAYGSLKKSLQGLVPGWES